MMSINKIRNFCVISHIDHGKSTLADRFLEITKTIPKQKMREQVLDQMELEQERGITIKLQPVRMEYNGFVLNLIDTPGHMDFYSEVERSLSAVEGAVLLVDAVAGVQAQTLSNLNLALKNKLAIIPVINKIDLPNARIKQVESEIAELISVSPNNIIKISAKNGTNVENVLNAVIKKIPAPKGIIKAPAQTLVFDAFYDSYQGVVAYLRVLNGELKSVNKNIGVFKPKREFVDKLSAGEIGWLATGERNLEDYRNKIGWQIPAPLIFASLYPQQESEFAVLKDAIDKLKLNDAALYSEEESSNALGRGFKCGFLGMLHLEIIVERLRREYKLDLTITSPSVNYKQDESGEFTEEPWISLSIMTPQKYFGNVMEILKLTRGKYINTEYLGSLLLIKYDVPLSDIIRGFYDKLKSVSSGYASMSYEPMGWKQANLTRLKVLIAGNEVSALSQVVPKEFAYSRARVLAKKLKEFLPRQNFAVAIQVQSDGRIIARETISAYRKDVTGHLYGGDVTRKRKLLEKQKRGKKRMREQGSIKIPQDVFVKLLKS